MCGFFELFLFPNFGTSKFETLNNPEYQLLTFKKLQNSTDFKTQEFKHLKMQKSPFNIFRISKHLVFDTDIDYSKNLKIIRLECTKLFFVFFFLTY
jgi:hypothetical protein